MTPSPASRREGFGSPSPTTTCSGTTASAAGEPGPLPARDVNGDTDKYVFRAFLGVLHEHIKVPVAVKDACIE